MVSTPQQGTPGQTFTPQHKNDTFTFHRIIQLAIRYWYFFIISLPISLIAVMIMHRYSQPVYQASCTLLFKSEDKNEVITSELINGIGLSPEARNIENQTFLIRSYRMIERTIRQLDFEIEYYTEGRFIDTEIYNTTPFKVVIDSGVPQILDQPIRVSYVSNEQIKISIFTEGGALYDFKSHQVTGFCDALEIEKTVSWDEEVTTPAGSFKLIKSNSGSLQKGINHHVIFRSLESITNQYRGNLSISNYNEGSSIMFLTVIGKTPAKMRRFLDQLCLELNSYNLDQKNEIANRSIGFIQNQLNMIADSLDRTQSQLLNFRKENRFIEPSASSERIADELFETEKKLKILQLKDDYFSQLKTKINQAPQSTDFMLPAFSDKNYPLIDKQITELMAANAEINSFDANTSGNNPYINNLKEKSSNLRQTLSESINKILENIEIEIASSNKELANYEEELNRLPELEKRYLQIDRAYKLNDAIYTFLLQKSSETQITKASNVPDNEIIDQASISGVISPNKKSNYSRALILGFVIPIGIIVLIELLNFKVRSKEEILHLTEGTPIIGNVPHSKLMGQNVIMKSPGSSIAESFRSIRTSIGFMSAKGAPQVIAVTSTNTGDGKTFVSLNLASAFAVTGKRTVILGFDLRKPKLSGIFQLHNNLGISNYLVGQATLDEICYETDQKNLWVIPAGDIPPNPSELIGSELTETLFTNLREKFDLIIVDTPPIGVVADARLLMSRTDANLYIVRYNYTRKDHLQQTMHSLVMDQVRSLGVIFNDLESNGEIYGKYYSTVENTKG